MNKKKILKSIFITAGTLLLLLLLIFFFWLGPTLKLISQTIGPKALGTPVTIESLSINPRKGIIHLSGFTISNPGVFGNSNAVSVAGLDISIDMGSVFSQTVLVHQVQVNNPHFIFEQSAATDNIAEYIRSVEDFIGYDPNAPPDPKAEKKKEKKREKKEKKRKKREDKPPKVVLVQSLEINDLQFHLAHTDNPRLDIVLGIDRLAFSMTNGIVQLQHIKVNNPGSLATTELFTLDEILVNLEPRSIHNPPLSIRDVQVINPHCYVEWAHDANTISEFLEISDLTQTRVQDWPLPEKDPGTEPAPAPSEAEEKSPPPELHHVGITNVQFHLVNSVDTNLSIRAMLEELEIDLDEGVIEFGRISISNPSRLETPDLFSLDGIDIQIDPGTLHSNTLAITDVQVRRPYAFLEVNPATDTTTELLKIADTITHSVSTNRKSNVTAPPPDEAITPEPQPDTPAAAPVALHNLTIEDIQIKLLDTTMTNAPTEPGMLAGIESISIKPVDGRIQIKNVTIPNPPGFFETNLFHLANLDVTLDPESVSSDQKIIHEVFINSPTVNMEQTETTGNGAELQKSLLVFIPPPVEKDTSVEQAQPDAGGTTNNPVPLSERPVVLEALIVTNFAANAILLKPIDPAATNETSRSLLSQAGSALNPMTHLRESETNTTTTAGEDEITLLGFEKLTVKPLEGTVDIANLRVGNPPDFANEHLVKMESFNISIAPDSMTSDTLLIKSILIHKPRVAYERQITTDNIKQFQRTIEGAMVRRHDTMEKVPEAEKMEPDEGQKVIIEHLLVDDGIVKAKISALPTTPIPLPSIEMADIGKEEGGATVGDVSARLFGAFYDAVIGVVANTTGFATDALKNLTGGLTGLVGMDGEEAAVETAEPEPEEKKKRRSLFRDRTHK